MVNPAPDTSDAQLRAYLDSDPTLPGSRRVAEAVRNALVSGADLRPDWRNTLGVLLDELERASEQVNHPDDRIRIGSAQTTLATLFLTVDQVDAAYLGATPDQPRP